MNENGIGEVSRGSTIVPKIFYPQASVEVNSQDRADTQPRFISKKEFARLLSISMPTVYRWINAGTVPVVRLGGRVLILASFVLELERQAVDNSKAAQK
jgi:excisionase family DNA binding protein